MQGREREIDTLSVRRPQPHTPNNKHRMIKFNMLHDYVALKFN